MEKLLRSLDRNKYQLLEMPGVVSVGIGLKTTRNQETGQLAIIIGVEKKQALSRLAQGENITRLLRNLPTDINEVGTIRFQGFAMSPCSYKNNKPPSNLRQNKMRPAVPGISIGHHQITAGTLGAVVYGNFPQGVAILSNNHVLANCSTGQDDLARPGDPIWQPGPYDGGSKNDLLAQLADFMPYHCVSREEYQKGERPAPNYMDAALALPLDKKQINRKILGLGQPDGTQEPMPGMFVMKSGRTTGLTHGKIITIHNTLYLENDGNSFIFEEQFATTPMSDNGDSGSLIVNRNKKAVGLLFAGSNRITYATPINRVLDHFRVRLTPN